MNLVKLLRFGESCPSTRFTLKGSSQYIYHSNFFSATDSGVLSYWVDLTSRLEAKSGARFSQVHQIKGQTLEVLLPQDRKSWKRISILGPDLKSKRAKLVVLVTCIFGGKIWGSDTNFRGKFWCQAPRPSNVEVPRPWASI